MLSCSFISISDSKLSNVKLNMHLWILQLSLWETFQVQKELCSNSKFRFISLPKNTVIHLAINNWSFKVISHLFQSTQHFNSYDKTVNSTMYFLLITSLPEIWAKKIMIFPLYYSSRLYDKTLLSEYQYSTIACIILSEGNDIFYSWKRNSRIRWNGLMDVSERWAD